jgi:hypothetical protein
MKRSLYRKIIPLVLGLLLMPALMYAQTEQTTSNTPPVEQPLIREGDFAVELVFSFALGETDDEVEAEDLLSSNGIAPRNGWIADYPVTPDIVGEIWDSIISAVDSNKLSMNRDEAARRYQQAKTDAGLEMRPYASGETHKLNQSSGYPDNTVINNYYYDQGPPVVTYYAPPPDYYYLYSWVPYPFWWDNFWFPGYFVLNDFHRVIHYRHRNVFISNHFNDDKNHRVYRIDPKDRFHGKTYAGIGAPKKGNFISPGIKNGSKSIFNRNRISPPSTGKSFGGTSRERSLRSPSEGISTRPPADERSLKPQSQGGKSFSPPSGGGAPRPPSGGRSSGGPTGGRPGDFDGGQRR